MCDEGCWYLAPGHWDTGSENGTGTGGYNERTAAVTYMGRRSLVGQQQQLRAGGCRQVPCGKEEGQERGRIYGYGIRDTTVRVEFEGVHSTKGRSR